MEFLPVTSKQQHPKAGRRSEDPRGMSQAELLALPVSFPLDTSNRALHLGRTTGYDLAKRGEYPVRVLRLGNAYRVTRADLLRYLGVSEPTASAASGGVSEVA
jgi:hypothetical protein